MKVIRNLSPNRWSEYKELRISAVTIDPQAFGSTKEEEDKIPESRWKKDLKDKSSKRIIFMENDDGKLIGLIKVSISDFTKSSHLGWIYSFFILPEYQKMGIGRKLMDEAFRYLRYCKATIVELNVATTQERAIKLYRKYGFLLTGIRRKVVKVDEKYFDYHVMSAEIL